MRSCLWLAGLLLLAGCASKQPESGQLGGPPEQEKKASARERARIHTDLGVSYYEAGKMAVALEELNEAIRIDRGYAQAWGARALAQPAGTLEVGRRADFVELDPEAPSLAGHSPVTVLDGWLLGSGRDVVRTVFVAGSSSASTMAPRSGASHHSQ